MSSRTDVFIRGKRVKFTSRVLKSGETAYYRDGRRAKSPYQIRVAKGVLSGLSVSEARGHPFGKYSNKLLTKKQIQAEFLSDIAPQGGGYGEWAARPSRKDGLARYRYFIKVSVTTSSFQERGYPDGKEEACRAVTLHLRQPGNNDASPTLTYSEVVGNFEQYALFTVKSYHLKLCNDDLKEDLLGIWRHKEE